ncbi:hypothetical protein [uncultured Parabacteroides sp.]|jgi:hypothetical protein|uniref:hypothetical protein n=1 Tax=uncultured Parabacteroides sp. TaxID=512312 RepID=UPI002805FB55|nr:hypothetical protein [uncultured Parabacteroides sp.]
MAWYFLILAGDYVITTGDYIIAGGDFIISGGDYRIVCGLVKNRRLSGGFSLLGWVKNVWENSI